MQFDLVSPERSLASLDVKAVQIPGADGDMTAMADHAPTITTLRPGILIAEGAEGGDAEYLVTGGFAEIGAAGVTVLAERALPKRDVTQADMDAILSDAKAALEAATPESVDDASKMVADVTAVAAQMGLTA